MSDLMADLEWRGLAQQATEGCAEALGDGSLTFYWGCDPTAPSLHVGNLVGIVTVRRLQDAGHRPVVLAGGATGMIGDPSFKSSERRFLDQESLERNVEGIQSQLSKYVDFSTPGNGASLVNNLEWTKDLSVIDFLRNTGKHFTVNTMITKESVRVRLNDREQGISFTEFTYSLLQAMDYWHLNRNNEVTLQLGGSDQWGNIVAGVDLVRRREGVGVHALCWPLVTKADGTKFGKTESGTIWLDSALTSPYQFHQFFLRTEDAMVDTYLKYFTFLDRDRIDQLAESTRTKPQERAAQRVLADEVTRFVHGEDERQRAARAASLLFEGDVAGMDEKMLVEVFSEVPSVDMARSSVGACSVIDALVATELCASKSAARKAIEQGGVIVNAQRVDDVDAKVETLLHNRYAVMRRGKKSWALLRFK